MKISDTEIHCIHSLKRLDRNANIEALFRDLPAMQVHSAFHPLTNEEPVSRGIRGCTLSHIQILEKATGPCLVLEDDACFSKPDKSRFMTMDITFPEGVGAILVGGEVATRVPLPSGLEQVITPFFGTHGVIYNTALLKERGFINEVNRLLAMATLGTNGMCYEGILFVALDRIGLKLACYDRMFFNTIFSFSDRTGEPMAPRNCNLDDGLMDHSAYEPILRELRFKNVLVVTSSGNVGDLLIHEATRYLLTRKGINFRIVPFSNNLPQADVYAWAGGGNVSGRYEHNKQFEALGQACHQSGKKLIILPQSIEWDNPNLKLASKVFLREQVSFDLCKHPNKELVPDLALAMPRLDFGAPTEGHGVFMRKDSEGLSCSDGNTDPIEGCQSVMDYVLLASRFRSIETDRLHFVIAALIAGVEDIRMHPGSYHKNLSMWKTWLEPFGVSFMNPPLTGFPAEDTGSGDSPPLIPFG